MDVQVVSVAPDRLTVSIDGVTSDWIPAPVWTAEPPKVAGDYLYAYRFNPGDDWTQGRMTLGKGGYAGTDTAETLWFGPIPELPGPVVLGRAGPYPEPVEPSTEGGET